MDRPALEREIQVAVRLVLGAAYAAEEIRRQGIQGIQKEDHTPVTQADVVSQVILLRGLQESFPEDRVIAEEFLTPGEESDLRASARKVLRDLGFPAGERDLERWVNYRGNPGGARTWMVDPIDGTKGYEKGLCYAVAMCLYGGGKPLFGCMAAPSLPLDGAASHHPVVAYGGAGMGAFWSEDGGRSFQRAHVSEVSSPGQMRLVGSRAHDGGDICGRFMAKTGAMHLIRLDGQAKYILLAMGRADLYLRSSDPSYGIAFPWDHCAGQAILEGAGGKVSDFDGKPLNYDQPPGRPIMDSNGLAASNGQCHGSILHVVRSIVT